jgi:ferredoxin
VALRLTLALLMLVVTAVVAGRRIVMLTKLIRSGTPAPGRTEGLGERFRDQLTEVFGQRRLLKWSAPGLAHFFTFWGFIVLGLTIIEAYGALVIKPDFAIPFFGRAQWLGFLEDFFAVAVLLAIIWFALNRVRYAPDRKHRASRFYGSHTGPAWVILGMISLVVITLLLYRGAQYNTGHFPYGGSKWPFASYLVAKALGTGAYNQGVETLFLLAQMAVIFGFTIIVTYSKHLHIATAPLNVLTKREPIALGALLPVTDAEGKPIDFADAENLSEDQLFGKGKIEDFSWKGYLDFATCTECGRCQSQCPAWNTDKPLSPKLLIMDLRDHLFAKAPYLIGGQTVEEGAVPTFEGGEHGHGVPEAGFPRVPGSGPEQATRPLVGTAEQRGVIDPDVLWSCTTCGACVE